MNKEEIEKAKEDLSFMNECEDFEEISYPNDSWY